MKPYAYIAEQCDGEVLKIAQSSRLMLFLLANEFDSVSHASPPFHFVGLVDREAQLLVSDRFEQCLQSLGVVLVNVLGVADEFLIKIERQFGLFRYYVCDTSTHFIRVLQRRQFTKGLGSCIEGDRPGITTMLLNNIAVSRLITESKQIHSQDLLEYR